MFFELFAFLKFALEILFLSHQISLYKLNIYILQQNTAIINIRNQLVKALLKRSDYCFLGHLAHWIHRLINQHLRILLLILLYLLVTPNYQWVVSWIVLSLKRLALHSTNEVYLSLVVLSSWWWLTHVHQIHRLSNVNREAGFVLVGIFGSMRLTLIKRRILPLSKYALIIKVVNLTHRTTLQLFIVSNGLYIVFRFWILSVASSLFFIKLLNV